MRLFPIALIATVSVAAVALMRHADFSLAQPSKCEITIMSPTSGSKVTERSPVIGNVSPHGAVVGDYVVVVVIHPDGAAYAVEPVAHVDSAKNEWYSASYFGTPTTPTGWHFEVQAFVAPGTPLKEGDRLAEFPSAACSSNIVHVNRQ